MKSLTLTPMTLLMVGAGAMALAAEDIRFPEDLSVVDVRDFGAVGDGVADDTKALQAAINRTGLIHLPEGVYRITTALKVPPREGSAPARRILQGAGRGRTVIRVADRSSEFADPTWPVPVFQISWGKAQAFRNGIRDLTIDVGSGNPGAIGCAFMASNQGGMHRVEVIAGEGSGAVGVDLAIGDNGPLLLNDLDIRGFRTGIKARYGQSMTLDRIRISGAETGIFNENAFLFTNALDITASATGVVGTASALFACTNSRIAAPLGLDPQGGGWCLRRVDATACATAVAGDPASGVIQEATSERHGLGPAASAPMATAVPPPTPVARWTDPTTWIPFGTGTPTEMEITHQGESLRVASCLPALAEALRTGGDTAYLPKAGLVLRGDLRIPATTRRLFGGEHAPAKTSTWTIIVDEASTEPLVIERFDSIYAPTHLRLVAPRPVVVSSMIVETIEVAEGAGPLFIEDCVVRLLDLAPGTQAWARQVNMEYVKADRAHVENRGGSFWCLGFKNEGDATMIRSTEGAHSEAACYVLANKATPSDAKPPMFIVEDAALVLTLGEAVIRQQPYGTLVRGSWKGTAEELRRDRTRKRGDGGSMFGLAVAGPER